jgi:hypothetical protein
MQHSMGTGAASQLRIPAGKAVNRLPGGFQHRSSAMRWLAQNIPRSCGGTVEVIMK